MGTNCAPIFADLFLYSYAADFIQRILRENENKLSKSFNFTHPLYRWLPFQSYVDIKIKETTDTARYAFYPNLHIEIDNERR